MSFQEIELRKSFRKLPTNLMTVDGKISVDRRLWIKGLHGTQSFIDILQVLEARELPVMDITGSSDPYAVALVNNQQFRTQTVWKNHMSPYWGEEFTLYAKRSVGLLILTYASKISNHEHPIKVTVWDEEHVGSDEVIGKIELKMTSLLDQELHEQWYPLFPSTTKDNVSGEINLKLKYSPPNEAELKPGKLFVSVVQGRHLASRDSNGLSDPYVKLYLSNCIGEKKKTHVIQETLNPLWREDFEL
jgi:Ca2+-dependent lipid-binding protein